MARNSTHPQVAQQQCGSRPETDELPSHRTAPARRRQALLEALGAGLLTAAVPIQLWAVAPVFLPALSWTANGMALAGLTLLQLARLVERRSGRRSIHASVGPSKADATGEDSSKECEIDRTSDLAVDVGYPPQRA